MTKSTPSINKETIANGGYLKGSTLGNIPIKKEQENSETQETD